MRGTTIRRYNREDSVENSLLSSTLFPSFQYLKLEGQSSSFCSSMLIICGWIWNAITILFSHQAFTQYSGTSWTAAEGKAVHRPSFHSMSSYNRLFVLLHLFPLQIYNFPEAFLLLTTVRATHYAALLDTLVTLSTLIPPYSLLPCLTSVHSQSITDANFSNCNTQGIKVGMRYKLSLPMNLPKLSPLTFSHCLPFCSKSCEISKHYYSG